MLLAVSHQDRPLDEGAQAKVALVRFLTRVRQDVPREGLLEGKRGTAVEAPEGPIPSVDERVPLEAAAPREHPGAPVAPELVRPQEVGVQLKMPVLAGTSMRWS